MVAAPNGRQLYIANRAAGVVTVVDTAVDKVTATIPITAGPPQYIAFSPDGRKAYVERVERRADHRGGQRPGHDDRTPSSTPFP